MISLSLSFLPLRRISQMNCFCPVSFNGLYIPMSSLAAWQGHLVERRWGLETARPWFIFWFYLLLTRWPWMHFLIPLSRALHSQDSSYCPGLLMGLRERWCIGFPQHLLFASLKAECRKDTAGQGGFGSLMTSSPSEEINVFFSCHWESIVDESNDFWFSANFNWAPFSKRALF